MSFVAGKSDDRMMLAQLVFRLTVAVILGQTLYRLLYYFVNGIPLTVNFRGYALQFESILTAVSILLVTGLGIALLFAFTKIRRSLWARGTKNTVRECPECLSFIPTAARRCAWCQAPLQPEIQG